MTSYADRLNECYKKALAQDDINLAVEIADRLKGMADTDVPDERIQKFVEAVDSLIDNLESGQGKCSYKFEYGGQNFEVKII